MTLEDLTRVETLGMGGFGRVELVSGADGGMCWCCCGPAILMLGG